MRISTLMHCLQQSLVVFDRHGLTWKYSRKEGQLNIKCAFMCA